MDLNFIEEAEKVVTFNLETRHFTTLTYKKEIQHLFKKHYFPELNLGHLLNEFDIQRLNVLIDLLKSYSSNNFKNLHNYNLRGIGPGEITLFFLINNSMIAGLSSNGTDLLVKDTPYEIKACKISRDGYAYDFKIGSNTAFQQLLNEFNMLCAEFNLSCKPNEISTLKLCRLKELAPGKVTNLEFQFKELVHDYFKNEQIIFINHGTSIKTIGRIEAVRTISPNTIFIDRITNGTIKPKILLRHGDTQNV